MGFQEIKPIDLSSIPSAIVEQTKPVWMSGPLPPSQLAQKVDSEKYLIEDSAEDQWVEREIDSISQNDRIKRRKKEKKRKSETVKSYENNQILMRIKAIGSKAKNMI